jgi:hypothetical protein
MLALDGTIPAMIAAKAFSVLIESEPGFRFSF